MTDTPEHETEEFGAESDAPEADEANEAADDEDDGLSGSADAPEPQGHGPTPEEYEAGLKKIAQSFATYSASVARNFPTFETDLVECLLCPSQHPGFLNVHSAGRVPKEIIDAVQMYLGFARELDYQPAPDTRTCGTCGGEGKVASGSHVPEHRVRSCPVCLGYGYEPPPGGAVNGTAAAYSGPIVAESSVPAGPPPDTDEWGEPRILPDGRANPNYGRMPVHKVAVEPWGATAGLTAQS